MPSIFEAGAFELEEEAPAKINLALHVTGLRGDGYHLLDMLVTFTRHGDRLGFSAADRDEFEISGRFGARLGDAPSDGNLAIRARDLLRRIVSDMGMETSPVKIHLEKNLPLASGIGGGSADAAATLRGLLRLWKVPLPVGVLAAAATQLGADVPMCLHSLPLLARGIGEDMEVLPTFPPFGIVLGNPLVEISTPAVFRALADKRNPAFAFNASTARPTDDWMSLIADLRNDLEPPARKLCGEIGEISGLMATQAPRLVRMSGSGATCFALFDDFPAAGAAADALHRLRPDWYFQATETIPGGI